MEKPEDSKRKLSILWISGLMIYLFASLQKVIIPGAIFSELQLHYESTAMEITSLGAIFMYAYAFSQLLGGLLVDRYGGMRVMVFGGLLLCLGAIVSALASELWILYLARVIVGFGAASVFLSITKETSRIYPNNFAMRFGVVTLVGYLGGVLGNAPFIAGVSYLGWEWAVILVGFCSSIAYLSFIATKFSVSTSSVESSAKISLRRFVEVLQISNNRLLLMGPGIGMGIYFVMQSIIGKKFLEDFVGMSSADAGGLMTLLMVVGAANGLLAPVFSKFLGGRKRIFMQYAGIGLVVSTVVLFVSILAQITNIWLIGIALVLLASSANLVPIVIAIFKDVNPDNIWGVAVSTYMFFAYILTAVLGNATGLLMDLFDSDIVKGIVVYKQSAYLAVFGSFMVISIWSGFNSLKIKEN